MQINRRNFIKLSGLSMFCKSAALALCGGKPEYESGRAIDPEAVKKAFKEPELYLPPLHPNCRCVIIPIEAEALNVMDQIGGIQYEIEFINGFPVRKQ